MIFEKNINMSASDAVQRFVELAKENGLGVLWQENLKSLFKEKGYFYPYNNYVINVCNPEIAVNVLNTNEQAAYFLPCKVSVFETEEAVKIGFAKPTKMITQIVNGNETKHYAAEIEDILIDIIEMMINES
jgi:uncharacterized protein (DUF302 family)